MDNTAFIAPALVLVAALCFLAAARDVSTVALLATSSSRPLALLQLGYMVEGRYESAAVVGVTDVVFGDHPDGQLIRTRDHASRGIRGDQDHCPPKRAQGQQRQMKRAHEPAREVRHDETHEPDHARSAAGLGQLSG